MNIPLKTTTTTTTTTTIIIIIIGLIEYIQVHMATRWTIRHGLMLLCFTELMI